MEKRMKPPLTYYGGKQTLAPLIISLIPEHTLYGEPFTGGGAVFFHKPASKVEVLNDINGELMNFYRIVQDNFAPLEKMIRRTLHCRNSFRQAEVIYHNPDLFDEIRRAWATVSKLLNNGKHIPPCDREKEKDRPFLAFTKEDHQKYERFISKDDASESTVCFYLRNYFRIWNLAIKEGYCSREQHHPARFIKFQPYKRIRTKKRSINQDYLHEIMELKFDPGTRMYRSQMLLQFIYYARGINFGDMCKLKWKNIANGTIEYKRSKNHRHYDYTLHPQALKVISYFKRHPEQSDSGYVFPFLLSIHDTPRKIDTRIESALKDFNEDLKVMAESVGWERKFTSYSLRHGFATHLRNNNVDISIIKEALGHEAETQTAVYLDDLDDKVIADEINRALSFNKKRVPKNTKRKGRRI